MIRTILTAATLSAVLAAGGAQAQTRVADQRAVATRDIDFNNPEKVSQLYGRLRAAAAAVCHSEVSDPATANADANCESSAVHDAVAQVDQPQLSQLAARDSRGAPTQLASRDSDRRGTR